MSCYRDPDRQAECGHHYRRPRGEDNEAGGAGGQRDQRQAGGHQPHPPPDVGVRGPVCGQRAGHAIHVDSRDTCHAEQAHLRSLPRPRVESLVTMASHAVASTYLVLDIYKTPDGAMKCI